MGSFDALLQAAKADPDSVDFTELRMAYAESSQYDPYRSSTEHYVAVCELLKSGEIESAKDRVIQSLNEHYLDIEMHILASEIYEMLGDEQRARHHARFAVKLLGSICRSGNGKTPETAFQVIDLAEEYAIMSMLNVECISQELRREGDHYSDVFRVRLADGSETLIYFNIDLLVRVWPERGDGEVS